ncbi:hypothetical protein NC653_016354 [Populus alba x Populus x berolinensis]|uniref:Uncharacterized protein n=1 Tax=Populus alba x Populus x berolinensis TaxID=444605 RepID=A0AAD6VZ85_9ROSI|nr:hypothetical protein NC653_016354 [Populus alba x Populus x berolinensis]
MNSRYAPGPTSPKPRGYRPRQLRAMFFFIIMYIYMYVYIRICTMSAGAILSRLLVHKLVNWNQKEMDPLSCDL